MREYCEIRYKNFINPIPKRVMPKKEEHSVKNFKIDTSHYKYKGPRVVRIIDIDY